MNARLLIALGLATALGCGLKPAKPAPEKQAPYAFPHPTHADADVKCANCHAGIEKATKLDPAARHIQLPAHASKQAACKDCHDTDPTITIPVRTTPPRFAFSHETHLKRVEGDCRRCHKELTDRGDTKPRRPSMAACTSCHKHAQDFEQARCRPCHVDLTYYSPVTAFKHGKDWIASHGALAKPSADTCAACHDQTYCAACHSPTTTPARPEIIFPERVDRGFIHRGDYVSRHMIDEGVNPASCRRCHGPAYCETCHTQQNLTSRAANFHDPHPQGWASPESGNFHGDAARRDISSCASCHNQGADAICVNCHKVGGFADRGGNGPHPASFISKHRNDDRRKNPVCTACHPN